MTKKMFEEKIANLSAEEWKFLGDKPVLLDFWTSWCSPCRIITPILEDLTEEYKGKIDIYKVNAEEVLELTEKFNIQTVPSLIFIPINDEPHIIQGTISKIKFIEQFKELFNIN